MVVHSLGHDHLRAGEALFVQFLHLVIRKGAVRLAESVVYQAVRGAIPQAAVLTVAVAAVSVASTDGNVESRAEAGLVVNLPEVVQ